MMTTTKLLDYCIYQLPPFFDQTVGQIRECKRHPIDDIDHIKFTWKNGLRVEIYPDSGAFVRRFNGCPTIQEYSLLVAACNKITTYIREHHAK